MFVNTVTKNTLDFPLYMLLTLRQMYCLPKSTHPLNMLTIIPQCICILIVIITKACCMFVGLLSQVLTELKELRVLYLHGNSIGKLSEVDKLGVLPFLHTLTLHGNTVENDGGYRGYVIAALPYLKTLDFSAVTRQERIMAQIWHRPGVPRKNTPKNQDD
ncbi:hypothetical protein DPEC_G00371290 [Dallia pectoralis]|nr:hypothetical protein DPEC_G00371290 [Dallia pectoralis]